MPRGDHIPLKIHLEKPVVQGDNELHVDGVGVAKRRDLFYL